MKLAESIECCVILTKKWLFKCMAWNVLNLIIGIPVVRNFVDCTSLTNRRKIWCLPSVSSKLATAFLRVVAKQLKMVAVCLSVANTIPDAALKNRCYTLSFKICIFRWKIRHMWTNTINFILTFKSEISRIYRMLRYLNEEMVI